MSLILQISAKLAHMQKKFNMLRKRPTTLWKMGEMLVMKDRLLWKLNLISTRIRTQQIQNPLILLPKRILQRSHMHQSSLHKKERAIKIQVPTNTSRMSPLKAVKQLVAAVAQTVALEASNATAPVVLMYQKLMIRNMNVQFL